MSGYAAKGWEVQPIVILCNNMQQMEVFRIDATVKVIHCN